MTIRRALLLLVGCLCSAPAGAWAHTGGQSGSNDLSGSLQWFAILAGLALVPVLLVMVTAFVKVVVVLGILRSALGLQGVPPMQVIIGLALILTLFIMAPVGLSMVEAAQSSLAESVISEEGSGEEGSGAAGPGSGAPLDVMAADEAQDTLSWERVSLAVFAVAEPLRQFLSEQAHPQDVALFVELGSSYSGHEGESMFAADDLAVLTPAFVVSELKEAFQVGFLLFIPFLVIDLVVANILLSLGMVMLSPTTVSLPFKLLLFVLVDGWYLLAQGLVSSYQVL